MNPKPERMVAPVAVDYGDLAHVGIMLPSGNTVAEPEILAMLPPGVTAHFTRVRLRGSSLTELEAMKNGIEDAAELLADAKVQCIIFHCTAVSTLDSRSGHEITERIGRLTGIPSINTGEAILSAIQSLGAKKISLVTPYIEEIHRREIGFLKSNKITVVDGGWLSIGAVDDICRLGTDAIIDFTLRHASKKSQAYFLSCTAAKTAGLVQYLETVLKKPVITSNQAMVWYLLHRIGANLPPNADRWGLLFQKTPFPATL